MNLTECITYLRDNNPKEHKALKEAINSEYRASEIALALKATIAEEGQTARFSERNFQRLVKEIREGRKVLTDYES